MAGSKGFTLMEIVAVSIIVGLLTAIVLPNFFASIEQTNVRAAQNNLLAISGAQSKYYEDYGKYYFVASGPNSNVSINQNLYMAIAAKDPFVYSCSNAPLPYQCKATDNYVTLTTSGASVNCTPVGSQYCPF